MRYPFWFDTLHWDSTYIIDQMHRMQNLLEVEEQWVGEEGEREGTVEQ